MADIEAEIARLQAQLANKRMEVAAIQPQWVDNDDDYSEESYYEEEIIEEYSDEEWEEEVEEEIIEEEVIEEEVIEEFTEVEVEPSAEFTPVQQVASPPTAAAAPLVSRRPWQSAGSKVSQPSAPAPAPAAPVVRKWGKPATSTTQPAPAAPSTGPSWATKNQIKLKKTPVPIISASSASEPKSAPASVPTPSPVVSQPPPPPGSKPVPRTRHKVRPPPGANGLAPVKNAPPPGPEVDAKPKGRIRIINWGANRRTNNDIQKATQPNFKGTGSLPSEREPEKVKRNYVIPENVRRPPDNTATGSAAPAPTGHKRRTIPDLPISPPGEETLWEKLLGPKLIANSKLQKKTTLGCMKDQELIGLYFGCKMKAECKYFHPRLQDFYFSASSQKKNLEIVYISSDRTLDEFKDAFARMPYLALPGGTARYKNHLSQSLKIIDQPTLVILDDEGMVVTVDAASQILSLERGNVEQAVALIDRWQKTRPVTFEQIQRDFALQHGKLQRGILYWQE